MTRYANLGAALSPTASPDAVALIDLSPAEPREVSYGELAALSRAAARGFVRRGLRRGDAVAVIAANRLEFLVSVFGALQAGITAVPVNHKLPVATIASLIGDAGVKLLLGDRQRLALCPDTPPRIDFDGAGPAGFQAFLDPGEFEPVPPDEGDVAMVIYTSGSTGRPKGVMFSHLGHLWALDQRTNASSPRGQRTLVAAPLYHQNGLASCQAALASGGAVVLLPGFTAASYIDAASTHHATMLTAVPTMIALVAREQEALARADLSAVRIVRVSSAPSTPELMAEARRIFPNATIVNGFGTTEGGPVCFGPHPRGLVQPDMSVGCAHPEVSLRLVRDGRESDEEGVLQIRSPALMLGYRGLPDQSRRAITADGYYDTGDIFRRDADGFFYFASRADDMFVCGGENIFPGEVEAVLLGHPAVHEAAVLPIADAIKGHKPVAFVVLKPGMQATEPQLRQHALDHAPPYQHPRRVWFLPEMPLAGTNKVDRRRLAELAGTLLGTDSL